VQRRLLAAALTLASGVLPVAGVASRTSFSLSTSPDQEPNRNKVWSHRTLGSGAEENTPEGLREVLQLGAGGVEVDIYYDLVEHQLFVQSEEFNQKKKPSSLTLAALLKNAPSDASIWLDFWSLKDLDLENAVRATERLETEIGSAKQRLHIFVESQSASYLRGLSGDLSKILWVDVAPADDTARGHRKHIAQLSKALMDYFRSGASAISMDYHQYDATAAKVFANVPLALFTINDPDDLCRAANDRAVQIILSDKPFYSLTCLSVGGRTKGG